VNKQLTILQKRLLTKNKVDALLISSSHNIGYLTGFFGFSKTEREGYVLVTKKHVYFFASGLNSQAVEKHIAAMQDTTISLVEISPRTPLTKHILATIITKEKIKNFGFEKYHLSFAEFERLKKDLTTHLVPTGFLIEELRMNKTDSEISAIQKACALGDKAFTHALGKIKNGITENELAFEIEFFIRKAGAQLSFPSIVAFGFHASVPHHVTSNQRLKTNSWILLDFGVQIDNYCSDMTRTVFFGKATTEQKRMYHTVLEAQRRSFEQLSNETMQQSGNKPIKAADIDNIARSYIVSQCFPTIPHSVGHGIGLEVHEPPRISLKITDILTENMVFSLEPGIYLPKAGGVRIEDLVVLRKKGPEFLTKAKRSFLEI